MEMISSDLLEGDGRDGDSGISWDNGGKGWREWGLLEESIPRSVGSHEDDQRRPRLMKVELEI